MPISPITTSDVYIKIDNQRVALLEGQRGQNIEVAVFNSFVPSFLIKMLQKILKKAGVDILAIGSQMYSLVEFIKIEQPEEKTLFLLIFLKIQLTWGNFWRRYISTRSLNIGYTLL